MGSFVPRLMNFQIPFQPLNMETSNHKKKHTSSFLDALQRTPKNKIAYTRLSFKVQFQFLLLVSSLKCENKLATRTRSLKTRRKLFLITICHYSSHCCVPTLPDTSLEKNQKNRRLFPLKSNSNFPLSSKRYRCIVLRE